MEMDQMQKCYELKKAIENIDEAANKIHNAENALNIADIDDGSRSNKLLKERNRLTDQRQKIQNRLEHEEEVIKQ